MHFKKSNYYYYFKISYGFYLESDKVFIYVIYYLRYEMENKLLF